MDPPDESINGFVTTGPPLINAKVEPIEVSGSVQDAFVEYSKYKNTMPFENPPSTELWWEMPPKVWVKLKVDNNFKPQTYFSHFAIIIQYGRL